MSASSSTRAPIVLQNLWAKEHPSTMWEASFEDAEQMGQIASAGWMMCLARRAAPL
jgi:hypothetical protein